jgi:hypothetical protein
MALQRLLLLLVQLVVVAVGRHPIQPIFFPAAPDNDLHSLYTRVLPGADAIRRSLAPHLLFGVARDYRIVVLSLLLPFFYLGQVFALFFCLDGARRHPLFFLTLT